MKKQILECWCKICGSKLKTKREYIDQDDTCDKCFNQDKPVERKLNKKPSTGSWDYQLSNFLLEELGGDYLGSSGHLKFEKLVKLLIDKQKEELVDKFEKDYDNFSVRFDDKYFKSLRNYEPIPTR